MVSNDNMKLKDNARKVIQRLEWMKQFASDKETVKEIDKSIQLIANLDISVPETVEVSFCCAKCGKEKSAYVPGDQVRNNDSPLKTFHDCRVCGKRTLWVEEGWNSIEVE